MTNELLFECGCEEIPARFIESFLIQMKQVLTDEFRSHSLSFSDIFVYGTYRRLVVHVVDLVNVQNLSDEWVKGPPKSIGFEEDSTVLTQAGQGFVKKNNIDPSEVVLHQFDSKPYLSYLRKATNKKTVDLLPTIFRSLFDKLAYPIAMRWGRGEDEFIRPVHWICFMYDNKLIPFNLFGVNSDNKTFGHRFLTKGKTINGVEIAVSSVSDFFKKLEKKGSVILNQHKRKSYIVSQLNQYQQHTVDEELLDEVNYLVEYPTLLVGEFDKKFLDIPAIILVECMKKHQKYFPVYNDTVLTNKFLFIGDNITSDNKNIIVSGNERVLTARLEDALFFWEEDKKQEFTSFSSKLSGLVYQHRIGSMLDKQQRLSDILCFFHSMGVTLIDKVVLKKVASYSKLDLVTQMVMEFPKLQGQMGALYALASDEDVSISKALSEQYLPAFYGGELPETPLGLMLSLADRFDHLVASFFNGAKPTGSQDPLALRRIVYSIFSLLHYLNMPFDFKKVVAFCYSLLAKEQLNDDRLYDFVNQRLKTFLIDKGLRYDVADSVLEIAYRNVSLASEMGALIESFRQSNPVDTKLIVETAVRVKRLAVHSSSDALNVNLFKEDIEHDAYKCLQSYLKEDQKLNVNQLVDMSALLNRYFEDVMVMDDDVDLKQNRLAFMQHCHLFYLNVSDFEKIVLD